MPFIPPWLRGTDTVGPYTQGLSQGLTAAAQQNAAIRAQQEMQLRANEQAMEQDRMIQNIMAKREENMILREKAAQQLAVQKEIAEAKARDAIDRWTEQMEFRKQQQASLDAYRQATLTARAAGKEFGPLEEKVITPDISIFTRKGSPAAHVVNKRADKSTDLTPGQIIQIRNQAARGLSLRPGEIGDEPEVQQRIQEAKKILSDYPLPPLRGGMVPPPASQVAEPEINPLLMKRIAPDLGVPSTTPAIEESPLNPPSPSSGKLTADGAREYLKRAKGDKAKARQMAIDDGWEL